MTLDAVTFLENGARWQPSLGKNISAAKTRQGQGQDQGSHDPCSPIALPHARAANAHATTPPSPLPLTSLNTLG
jgi:hypothetical protein